ncbi:unnamed protein product [Brassica rapa subsp. narinosa]
MHLPCMGLILFQVLALHTLVFYCQASSFTDQTDKQALLEFQSNLSPSSRVSLASWNESFDLCNWIGVTCARKHKRVTTLNLSGMKLSGVISHSIGNLSFLTTLSLAHNSFHGSIPPEVGKLFRLQHLNLSNNLGERLDLAYNRMEGEIPKSMSTLTRIKFLRLAQNKFSGVFPPAIYNPLLTSVSIHPNKLLLRYNSLGSYSSRDLDFLGSLNNCTQLQYLGVGYNRLGGKMPHAISNLSNQLTYLFLGGNFIFGSIPHDIGNLESLQTFKVEQSLLTGELPTSLGMQIRKAPEPSLLLDYNMLHGSIPQELMEARSLVALNVSYNNLTGDLPSEVGKLENLIQLYVSHNQLSGHIPQTLGSCLSLEEISLNRNLFEGSIINIRGLRDLKFLDLSNNNLSGSIPGYLVNLSVNSLEGPVPSEGAFRKFSQVSIFGNINLCGGIPELQLRPCSVEGEIKRVKSSVKKKKLVIGIGAGVAMFVLSVIGIISLCWLKKRNRNDRVSNMFSSTTVPVHERVSYEELHNASGGFSLGNTIGSGNFGVVYKALLGAEDRAVAIKVLNLSKPGAAKSFSAECEALKGVRHRNLVKLLTACSSVDYKAHCDLKPSNVLLDDV